MIRKRQVNNNNNYKNGLISHNEIKNVVGKSDWLIFCNKKYLKNQYISSQQVVKCNYQQNTLTEGKLPIFVEPCSKASFRPLISTQ